MTKKKILYCIHDLRGRGAEKVLATLLRKFDRNRYVAGVFVYHDTFTFGIPEDVELISAHLKTYPPSVDIFTKLKLNILKIITLGKALKSYKPDIAISISGTNINLILSKYLFFQNNIKVILSEHTFPSVFIKESNLYFTRILTSSLVSLTYRFADLIITPSGGVQEDLSSNYKIPPEKVNVIQNPLDIEHVRNAALMDPDFAFPVDDSTRIGFIGGLSREKNIPCLIKALGILKKNGREIRLFLIGEGDERGNLENLAKEITVADRVHFLGFRKNPYAILSHFDVLVVTSFFETFSYVMLEAMACGVPVVSTKWRGCEDIYRDMENCLLVPIDDPDSLARAIERIMNQKEVREKLIRNGYDLANRCDAGSVVKIYERKIEGVLAGSDGQ